MSQEISVRGGVVLNIALPLDPRSLAVKGIDRPVGSCWCCSHQLIGAPGPVCPLGASTGCWPPVLLAFAVSLCFPLRCSLSKKRGWTRSDAFSSLFSGWETVAAAGGRGLLLSADCSSPFPETFRKKPWKPEECLKGDSLGYSELVLLFFLW